VNEMSFELSGSWASVNEMSFAFSGTPEIMFGMSFELSGTPDSYLHTNIILRAGWFCVLRVRSSRDAARHVSASIHSAVQGCRDGARPVSTAATQSGDCTGHKMSFTLSDTSDSYLHTYINF
jgi:hypothetical protein